MSGSKLENSLASGGHQYLLQFTGDWKGTSKTYFEPGVVADESPVEAVVRPLFDKRFVQLTYKSSLQGKAFEGWMILGLHLLDNSWQMAWVDTFHMGTGIMHASGPYTSDSFNVLGSYSTGGENPEFWGWRTVIEKTAEGLSLKAYNIEPSGPDQLAIEMVLR